MWQNKAECVRLCKQFFKAKSEHTERRKFLYIRTHVYIKELLLDIWTLFRHTEMDNNEKKLALFTESEAKYNGRTRFFYKNGVKTWYDTLIVSDHIFNPYKVELSTSPYSKHPYHSGDMVETDKGLVFVRRFNDWELKSQKTDFAPSQESVERSARRARAKLFELAICNPDLDVFATLTIDPQYAMRTDYAKLIKQLKDWLNNRVRRKGLKYIIVPEFHKKGGIHLHALINRALELKDSDTVICPGYNKPVKRATARKKGHDPDTLQRVYNIPEWEFGFTTAMIVTDRPDQSDHIAACGYVSKYITKESEKIGGRWYLSGGKLERLQSEYFNSEMQSNTNDPDLNERSFELFNRIYYKAKPKKL